jgi:hypothetical protein
MADAAFIERVRWGSPGLRLVLVPKREFLDRVREPSPPANRGAAAVQTVNQAKRFVNAVDPALKELEKIGLTPVTHSRTQDVQFKHRETGEFEPYRWFKQWRSGLTKKQS